MSEYVYLAGGIAGLRGADACDWRHQATLRLGHLGIRVLNPMRAKFALGSEERIATDCSAYESRGVFYRREAIMSRDRADVKRSTVVLANFLGADRVSIGTCMELGWAYDQQTPVVAAIEDSGNPHDGHPMLLSTIGFRCVDLDEAIDAVAVIVGRGR